MALYSGSLDANVLLRLLLNDEPKQHAAAEALFAKNTRLFAVADITLMQLIFALENHYKFSREAVAEAIAGLTLLPQIDCNKALLEHALPSYIANANLSFEDCCLTAYAKMKNAEPLWTFDKDLAAKAANVELA